MRTVPLVFLILAGGVLALGSGKGTSGPASPLLAIVASGLKGVIAERSGVSRDTIRYYEKLGLLPPAARTSSGYRLYPETLPN